MGMGPVTKSKTGWDGKGLDAYGKGREGMTLHGKGREGMTLHGKGRDGIHFLEIQMGNL